MSETVRRRTVAKGAAWSVPVLALASAAPAAASSPTCEISLIVDVSTNIDGYGGVLFNMVLTLAGSGCDSATQLGQQITLEFTLPTSEFYSWESNELTPGSGTAGSTSAATLHTYTGIGDSANANLRVRSKVLSPGTVTVGFSAPGLAPGTQAQLVWP